MEDARRAAAALLAEGAEEVFLYGSLAHGEATAHSDIDLVALFADIDYNERYELTLRLEKAASEAIAQRWPVQVFTTDRPEWEARIEQVPSSFESHISTRGLVPVGESSRRGEVQWGKAMVRPMSDPEEALRKFGDKVLSELEDLQTSTVANKRESDPDYILQEDTRLNRMVRVCAKAAMAVEKTIKVLAVLHSDVKPDEAARRLAGHNISACLRLLPPGLRMEIADCLNTLNINLQTMSSWRIWATYPDNLPRLRPLADDLAANYVIAAVELAGILYADLEAVIDQDNEMLQKVTIQWEAVSDDITRQDVRTGRTRRLDLDL